MNDLQNHERWLYGEFNNSVVAVLATLTNSQPRASWNLAGASAATDPNRLVISHSFNGIDGAAVWIVASEPNWRRISQAVLEVAGIDDADDETVRSNFIEVAGQTMSGLGQALSMRLKREITSNAAVEATDGLPSGLQGINLEIDLGAGKSNIAFAVTPQLLDAISERTPQVDGTSARVAEVNSDGRALSLLFDVELPVSVSFGRAQLPLKDIIKLTSGSIVELNRAISEPVEIIVNNCVIARGDVVVVEGNYGVRIQQVVSRQERLRTLS